MRSIRNILWLCTKEFRALLRDAVLIAIIFYAFGPGIYVEGQSVAEDVNNAAVAFVDEDRSALSRAMAQALYPPYFQRPVMIPASTMETAMNQGLYTFIVVLPHGLEADIRAGRQPEIQINVDATATQQASIGTAYLVNILTDAAQQVVAPDATDDSPVNLVVRRAFNSNGNTYWFGSILGLLNQLTMITIILTGAAIIREREHGTLEHLLVMPVRAFEIALSKVLANGAVIFLGFVLGMLVVIEDMLHVPMKGQHGLLFLGTVIYLFAASAFGILLGIVARTMAQFALLLMMTIMPMMILSGGMSPIESQPDWLQPITWLLPSRHYLDFATAIVHRGAGFGIVWPEFLATFGLGAAFFALALVQFRRSISSVGRS
ncbi:ABC transporter permease [Actibacterium ureilyticum]|uniref:ABC transporter permease n=1 Tax=Actibacterium ureilyticum TaxID=1590614 RepID=UPI000BAA9BC4|nr:ABC transporter permease [Actibacterium ureilyticum]